MESPLVSKYYGKTKYKEITGNLYYKHSFTTNRKLEFDGMYNYSNNSSIGSRESNSQIYSYINDIDLYNTRHAGRLDINYSDIFRNGLHFEAGSNTEYAATHIDDITDAFPLFLYKRTAQYLYAGIDNNKSKSRFNYVLSLGLDMIFADAGGTKHSYIDFVPSLSLSYKITKKQNLKISYSRSRELPPTSKLNPYNTSTDSLEMMIGNPYLSPIHNNKFRVEYNLRFLKLRISPFVEYNYLTDLIENYGYMDNNIYVSTYQNYGHSGELKTGVTLNINMPCGYIGLNPYFYKNSIKGMPYSGNRFELSCYGYAFYKKVSVDWFFNFIPERSYSLYTKTESGPLASRLHIVWRPVQAWAFTFQIQNFLFPRAHSKTWTINGDYLSYTSSVQRTLAPMISIGVWYNFVTRNFKWRNKKSFNDGYRELENLKAN